MTDEKPQPSRVTKKTYLDTVAKVKRLNYKLSQMEKIMEQMEAATTGVDVVSAKQVQAWAKTIRKELGKTPPSSTPKLK